MKTEKQTVTELITACRAQEQKALQYKRLLEKEIDLKNGLYYYILTKGLLEDYTLFSGTLESNPGTNHERCLAWFVERAMAKVKK